METNFVEGGLHPQKTQPQKLRVALLYQTIAAIALSVIPILLLLFFLAPSMSTPIFEEGAENIYGLLGEKSGIGSCAIGLLVLSCVAIVFAIPLLLGVFREHEKPLLPPLLILETCLSLALVITSAVLTAQIRNVDKVLGLITVGASPILALVFSSLAALAGVVYIAIAFVFDPLVLALQTPYRPKAQTPPSRKWIFSYVIAAVFGTFAIALFLFLLAQLTDMLGEGITFYQLLQMEKQPVYTDCTIAILVFACILAVTVFIQLLSAFSHGTAASPGFTMAYSCFSLVQLILASVIIAQVRKEDGGMGLAQVGAGPILILIFSLLTLLFGIIATVAPYLLRRKKEIK